MACNFGTLEQNVRKEFRNRWDGWLDTFQPAHGGTVGVCDTQIMFRPPLLIPVELKRGLIEGNRLFLDTIRPPQVRWHTMFQLEGGRSYFFTGAMKQGELLFFIMTSEAALTGRAGGLLIGERAMRVPIDPLIKNNDPIFSSAIKHFLL